MNRTSHIPRIHLEQLRRLDFTHIQFIHLPAPEYQALAGILYPEPETHKKETSTECRTLIATCKENMG